MHRNALITLILLLAGATGAAAAESDEMISSRLFRDLLAGVEQAAHDAGAGGIAVRGQPRAQGPEYSFFSAVGNRLLEEGFEVWIVGAGEQVPDGVLALDMKLTTSEIDYPRQTRNFLGIGQARVLRRVSLGADLRLTDPADGQLIYNAEPVRVHHEWLSYSDADAAAGVRPDWMGAAPIADLQERNPWWQRALVVGIVGGVTVLYFGGTT